MKPLPERRAPGLHQDDPPSDTQDARRALEKVGGIREMVKHVESADAVELGVAENFGQPAGIDDAIDSRSRDAVARDGPRVELPEKPTARPELENARILGSRELVQDAGIEITVDFVQKSVLSDRASVLSDFFRRRPRVRLGHHAPQGSIARGRSR